MSSRQISDLAGDMPDRANAVVEECKQNGVDILIYCTTRSLEEQARLYRQSRSAYLINIKIEKFRARGLDILADAMEAVGPQANGPHVTNAAPGESYHNYGMAFDAVPIVDGKAVWESDAKAWGIYGKACVNADLEWAGHWKNFVEYPHAQMCKGGNPLKEYNSDYINEILKSG